MEEKDSLAVYYGKNLWTAPQGAPAQAVPVDWQFTWAGHLCRIPALYVSCLLYTSRAVRSAQLVGVNVAHSMLQPV